ncbi:uncharacterized protein LOC111691911 [Anoplophora glabripennis]|uniref:uncharacterized protein LOC111691911 n=1 Tax=Anoplophora glabripennis TaxID=217634 RepID=UPI000C7909A3|nr:uncharacterized protein LOC111691911 [Anoplophora glabripennis]
MGVRESEPSDRTTWGNCTKLDLYCKNVYNPIVKVSDWEKYSESLPIDVNPYCPTAFDLHFSHYNKIGKDENPVNYTSTTHDMLAQVFTKRREFDINPNKAVINFDDEKKIGCSSASGADYVTTMQHSFLPPYPYLLKRLSVAEPPHFFHRFLKAKGSSKFLDDDYIQHIQRLQMYKSYKYVSYNPCTGYYTDGTLGDVRDLY